METAIDPTLNAALDHARAALSRSTDFDPAAAVARGASMEQAARKFEAMFANQMIGFMFEGLDVDPMFGGGPGEATFRSMLRQEYATLIAEGPGLGVADQVLNELLKSQEEAAS